MSRKQKEVAIDPQNAPVTPVQRIRTDWRQLVERMSYRGIVANIPFLAYVAVLIMLYITNSNRAVQIQNELNKQHAALKELRWRHMDAQTRLMNAGVEEEIIRRGAGVGLAPLTLPAYSITTDSLPENAQP